MNPNDDPAFLTDKQLRFVHEYLIDHNAGAAARRSGYAAANSRAQGAELLRNPAVQMWLSDQQDAMFDRLKVSAFTLLEQRVRVAFFDPAILFNKEGKPIPLHELAPETKSVLEVTYAEHPKHGTTKRVRQSPRAPALAALEKHYAQFLDLKAQADAAREKAEELRGHQERVARKLEEEDRQRAAIQASPAQRAPRRHVPEDLSEPVAAASPVPPARSASVPASVPDSAPEPHPSLTQRAVGAVKQLAKALEPAKPVAPARPASKPKRDKYWVNLNGEVDLSHPDVPDNVRQRLEEQKREREEWQARRDNRRWMPDVREGGPRPDDARPKYALTAPVFGD